MLDWKSPKGFKPLNLIGMVEIDKFGSQEVNMFLLALSLKFPTRFPIHFLANMDKWILSYKKVKRKEQIEVFLVTFS